MSDTITDIIITHNIKDRISVSRENYAFYQRGNNDMDIKMSDLAEFINERRIKALRISGNAEIFNALKTCKLEEIHLYDMSGIDDWNSFKELIQSGVLILKMPSCYYDEHVENIQKRRCDNIIDLLKIPTLRLLRDDGFEAFLPVYKNKIIDVLSMNYTLLFFGTIMYPNFEGEFECNKREMNDILYRNRHIYNLTKNKQVHHRVLDFAIVMSKLIDVPYVLLEIFDWFDWNHFANHHLKIQIIQNVCNFRRNLETIKLIQIQ